MRVRKKDNFSPSSLSRFHTSDDSRIAEMGPGRLERPEGDEEPSVLPPRSRSDQVVHLWNRRCTREHHGKKWDFLWLSQMRNWRALLFSFRWTSLLFWAWDSWCIPAHSLQWKKAILMHRQSGFQNRPSASSEIRCRISTVWCYWSEGVLVVVKILHFLQRFQKFKCQRNLF